MSQPNKITKIGRGAMWAVVAVAVGGVLPGLPMTVTVCETMVAHIHGCNCAPANSKRRKAWSSCRRT